MLTTITIIIAVALLAALGSKIFFKNSSKTGNSNQDGNSMDSKDSGSSSDTKKGVSSVIQKALKISSDYEIKGVNLFHAPAEPQQFTGRKEVQKKIVAQISTPPTIIGISGFSGVGKTTLAVSLIKIFASQFPGGALFMDMQGDHSNPPSAEDMMRRIILKFYPAQVLPDDDKKLTKLYRTALKKQNGVLILDNASGAKQVKSLIPPASCLMIVTSTKPVVLPKIIAIDLPPMESLESHTLLTRLAPDLSPAEKEISKVCQGIPLALEIIGRLFAINSTMAPDYFATKFMEVAKTFERDEETRNLIDGVRTAISLSYHMLPDKTTLVLRKLTVFPGSFTASAASFICEDPKSLSLVGLEKYGLVQHNTNTDRYSLHHQVKKFVKPLLTPGERGIAQKRLAAEYMNVLETAHQLEERGDKDAIKGYRLFDLELENITAGMEWGQKHCNQDKEAARICSAYIENGSTMIGQRLSSSQCIQWFEAALAASRQLEDKEAERKHLLSLGQQYALSNQPEKAVEALQNALIFCKKEGSLSGQKTALQQLSQICLKNSNYNLAIEYMEENLEMARTSGDKEEEFKLLVHLTKSCMENREYNKAVHTGEEAMALAKLNHDKPLQVSLLHSLGIGYMEIKEAEQAFNMFKKALELSQVTPNAPLQKELIKLIGDSALKAGNIPGALKYLLKGLDVVRKAQNLPAEGAMLTEMAALHMANPSDDNAMKYFEEVLIISQKIKDRLMEGRALWLWSQELGNTGNLAGAVSRGLEAQKIYEELKKPEARDIRAQIEKWSKD